MEWKEKIDLFRSRFYGRQDVYGRQWVMQKEDGSQVRGYAPVCDHLWKDFCHIKLKDGVQCTKCEHRQWAPVTEESVKKHIVGEEAHIYYVLQGDGKIKFGALDFDMKPGKEDKGYSFEDVMGVSRLLTNYGLPHYVARSTGAGYHLYVFFEEFIPAYKFRSFVLELFDRVGFMELLRQGIKPLPEFFPKQSYPGRDGIGNGIKPPMIEPQIERGRNCWVDAGDNVIPNQWAYFQNMKTVTEAEFDRILTEQQIHIVESEAMAGSPPSGQNNYLTREYTSKKWRHPITGSIEKVLDGCSSFRKIRDKVVKGDVLGHSEGFALYHICMHTQDGTEWFKKNVKGWGENDKDLRQLEHSLDKNYAPWTCKKLQETGICPVGTQCFDKKPPKEIVDGMEVVRDDIPRDKWPEPSPIRYAYGKGEDFLQKLQAEVLEVKKLKDQEQKISALKALAQRIQVFDESQQKEFKEYVREQKVLKRNEISKIFNEASDEHEESTKKILDTRDDCVVYDDNYYMKADPGYIYVKPGKDNKKKLVKLCSVDILILEERVYQDGNTDEDGANHPRTMYYGKVKLSGLERKFEISVNSWYDNSEFLTFFGSILGSHFCPLRANLEYLRQAIMGFSRKVGIEKHIFVTTQGYYDDTYLSPTCIIDSTGVRPNTTQRVELAGKETKSLDFEILSDGDLTDTLMHIKKTFLSTWPEMWTYTGIAHTLTPCVMGPFGWLKRPTLFYEGLTGGGKSELTQALQYFWGHFPSLANFFSTSKGIRELGYQFKDATLVIDDYKGLSKEQISAVKETILRTYDGSSEFKCNKNTDLRTPKASRCLYIMSGEEFIANDAAVVARTILIETNKHNTMNTEGKLREVHKYRPHYRGITPKFMNWCLKKDKRELNELVMTYKSKMKEDNYYAQNIDRIAGNLAMNYAVWDMFTKFMVECNAASLAEKEIMDMRHWSHMIKLRNRMIERCASEQSSEVFLRLLSQMIASNEVVITGLDLDSPDNLRKTNVGFVTKDIPDTICLFPKIVFETVKSYSRNAPILGTEQAIGRQLEDQNALSAFDKGRNTKNIRSGGKQLRVWCVKKEFLGIIDFDVRSSSSSEINNGKIIEFRSPQKEDFGIL